MEQQNGNARQRIVPSEEQILALLEEYDKSGFNVKDFCEVGLRITSHSFLLRLAKSGCTKKYLLNI